jgi:hypothetical protein
MRKYKNTLKKKYKNIKHNKYRTYQKKQHKRNRYQIGCSNVVKKNMTGGGYNVLSQPFENVGYTMFDTINNTYNNFFGYNPQPISDTNYQPYLQ